MIFRFFFRTLFSIFIVSHLSYANSATDLKCSESLGDLTFPARKNESLKKLQVEGLPVEYSSFEVNNFTVIIPGAAEGAGLSVSPVGFRYKNDNISMIQLNRYIGHMFDVISNESPHWKFNHWTAYDLLLDQINKEDACKLTKYEFSLLYNWYANDIISDALGWAEYYYRKDRILSFISESGVELLILKYLPKKKVLQFNYYILSEPMSLDAFVFFSDIEISIQELDQ